MNSFSVLSIEYSSFVGNVVVYSVDADELSMDTYGGAIYYNGLRMGSSASNSMKVRRTVFSSNEATRGGALVLHGKDIEVLECSFTSNTATLGAVYISEGDGVIVSDSNFSSNRQVAVSIESSMSVSVAGCRFEDSESDSSGAALSASNSREVSITDSVFERNNATGGSGGALFIQEVKVIIVEDCSFIGNFAFTSGGGIFLDDCESVEVSTNVLRGNAAGSYSGGGLFISTSRGAVIRSNVFSNNTALMGGGAILLSLHIPELCLPWKLLMRRLLKLLVKPFIYLLNSQVMSIVYTITLSVEISILLYGC
jgi:predicted outer membrane repeat protein